MKTCSCSLRAFSFCLVCCHTVISGGSCLSLCSHRWGTRNKQGAGYFVVLCFVKCAVSVVAYLLFSLGVIGRLCSVTVVLPGPEVVKHFSYSTQLSMKFVLLRNLKVLTIAHPFLLNIAEHLIFSATNQYENANNSWHFHIY